MGKRKITCNNNSCKHHIHGGCDTCITLDGSGKCESFEKGFAYYFHIVWDALDNKNFIDMVEIQMNPELKTGLYYVMDCYGLGFSEMEWGMCRMVMLKDGKEGKPLKYEEIIEREMNMEKFSKHLENFNNGIMPQMQQEQDATGQQDTEEKEFGWLSPTGVFTESPFGTHEESAEKICEEKGFTEEYWNWVKENRDNEINHLMRDFLSEVKGYCLIHNPSGFGVLMMFPMIIPPVPLSLNPDTLCSSDRSPHTAPVRVPLRPPCLFRTIYKNRSCSNLLSNQNQRIVPL